MKFLLLLLFFLLVFYSGIRYIVRMLKAILGIETHTYRQPHSRNQSQKSTQEEYSSKAKPSKKKKKIFTESDGEYVDYEEVKD